MRKQSERFGTTLVTETVATLDVSSRPFKFSLEWSPDEVHTADAVILATGANARRLHLPGEETYWQKGISACAVCDGALPMFRKQHLVVIGGGDSAAEEATFLTKFASHVYVLVRRDRLRASSIMAKKLLSNPKVTVLFNTVGVEVKGSDLMTHIDVKNVQTGKIDTLEAKGLFYAIGHDPSHLACQGGRLTWTKMAILRPNPGPPRQVSTVSSPPATCKTRNTGRLSQAPVSIVSLQRLDTVTDSLRFWVCGRSRS